METDYLKDKIKMMGDRILVSCRYAGGEILLPEQHLPKRENYPSEGVVVAIGSDVKKIKVGDRVNYSDLCGTEMGFDFKVYNENSPEGKLFHHFYLMMRESDVNMKILIPFDPDQVSQSKIILMHVRKPFDPEPSADIYE